MRVRRCVQLPDRRPCAGPRAEELLRELAQGVGSPKYDEVLLEALHGGVPHGAIMLPEATHRLSHAPNPETRRPGLATDLRVVRAGDGRGMKTGDMTSTTEIRPAEPEDLTAVLSIHSAHDPDMRGIGPASPKEQATWDRMMNTNDLTVYLAEIEGRPAGTATVMLMPNITYSCAPTVFIEAVVVVPKFRRRGVATRILDRVLEDAEPSGCDKVHSFLTSDMQATAGMLSTPRPGSLRRRKDSGSICRRAGRNDQALRNPGRPETRSATDRRIVGASAASAVGLVLATPEPMR